MFSYIIYYIYVTYVHIYFKNSFRIKVLCCKICPVLLPPEDGKTLTVLVPNQII